MTVIDQSRGPLDGALEDPANTLLILAGDAESDAQKCHDCAENDHAGCDGCIDEPWRRSFILRDLSVLTGDELERWFEGDAEAEDRFAVHRCSDGSVKEKGAVDALMRRDEPDCLRIKRVF